MTSRFYADLHIYFAVLDGRSVSGSYPVRQLISDCVIRLGEAELKVKGQ